MLLQKKIQTIVCILRPKTVNLHLVDQQVLEIERHNRAKYFEVTITIFLSIVARNIYKKYLKNNYYKQERM